MKELRPKLLRKEIALAYRSYMPASKQACKNYLDRLKQAGLLNSHDPQDFLPRMGNVVNIIVCGLTATNCAKNWIDGG